MANTHINIRANWIKPNSKPIPVSLINGTDFNLQELKRFVDGHIEIINLGNGTILVINEEGKLKGLPINPVATVLFLIAFPGTNDYIVGDVLHCHEELVK